VKKYYFNVLRRADILYTKMELRGFPVHVDTALKVKAHLEHLLSEVEDALQATIEKAGITGTDTATYASPKKLAKLIWGELRLVPNPDPTIAYTDPKTKETLSTSEDALIHVKNHPFVEKLLEWRALAKALSTYALPMLESGQTYGKLITSYKLAKVVTGRTASGKEEGSGAQGRTAVGMNLQNIPPTYGIKDIIRSEDDDWWIMECDFSQIELRIAGELSGDATLLWAYQNGIDLHTYRAQRTAKVTEEEWEALDPKVKKKFRTNAKPVNFGYLYGMSWRKFRQYALVQYGVDFTSEEAQENRRLFFEDHHGLEKWYGKQERMAQRLGYVETLSGQRRHLLDIHLDPDSGKEAKRKYQEAVRQSINSPVQGFASHLKTMAAIEIDSILDPKKAKLFGEIHDSILILVRKSAIIEVMNQVLPIMRHPKLLDILGINLKVPIEADVEVGPSLGEKKGVHEWLELYAV
jgi:DNA polymerase-1